MEVMEMPLGFQAQVDMGQKSMKDSNGNWCNSRSRGEQNWLSHNVDMRDMTAFAVAQFAPLPSSLRSVGRGQTGGNRHGRDTFGIHQDLCHNGKSFGSCCISGSKCVYFLS
jgi:hypothetical protein